MCDEGNLQSFTTPGGHRRIALADLEAFRSRGDTDTKNGRSSVSSPSLQYRKEALEELRLLIEEKKARGALQDLEEQERERREQEEAAREEQANEARREQFARDRERAERERQRLEGERQREADKQWQEWTDHWIQYALNLVSSPDVRSHFASEIQTSVQEGLVGLGPSRAPAIVEQVVTAAARRAIEPWLRQQEVEVAVKQGIQELSFLAPTEWQLRAQSAVREAICRLPPHASAGELYGAASAAGKRIAEEYDQHERRHREQCERAATVQRYLLEFTFPYLEELAKKDIDFEGETLSYSVRINADIRQKLIDDRSLTWLNAKQRVRQLIDAWIATELNEGTRN